MLDLLTLRTFTGATLEGAEGALAPPEFEGSEKRTERETDNRLLIAPPESKSLRSPCFNK